MIGLTTYTIFYGKNWLKSTLEEKASITKVVHMELSTDSMEEATHLITKVIKGEIVKYIYAAKIGLTPTINREQSSLD